MATVTAKLNNFRLAPRKVRAVVNLVKGKNVLKALEQLEFLVRRPAEPVIKLLRSALANAENNFSMVRGNLYIKEFYVDEGVKLKRYRPKAFGRANPIQKKTSHIRLVLAEKVPGLKVEKKVPEKHEHIHDHGHEGDKPASVKPLTGKPEIKTELGKKVTGVNRLRKIFQRKQV